MLPFRRRHPRPAPEGQGTLWEREHPDPEVARRALRERAAVARLRPTECTHTCVSAPAAPRC